MRTLLRTLAVAAGLLALTEPASAFWHCHRPVVVVNVGPAPVAPGGAGYGYAPMGYAPMGYAPYGGGYGGCYGSGAGAGCTGGAPSGAAPDCRQGAGAKPPKTSQRLKELGEQLDGMLARLEASKVPSTASPVAAAPAPADPDGIVARTRQWQQRRADAVSAHKATPAPAPLPPVIVKAADR